MKNIVYVVSFLAFSGLNAAAAEEVPVGAIVQRTAEGVLLELAGAHPAVGFTQRNFFGRAGGNLRVAGVYAYHVLKYPVVLSASYLPVSWVLGEGQGLKTLYTGAVGALGVLGFYKGICTANKELKNVKKLEEYPVLQNRLTLAADRIAQAENAQGALDVLGQRIITQQYAATQQAEEQRVQFQLQRTEAARLGAVQIALLQAETERRRGEEQALRASIAEQTAIAEHTASNLAQLRADAQEVARGLESLLRDGLVAQFERRSAEFARIDEWHMNVVAIESNPDMLTAEGLERLATIKRQQDLNALGLEARNILTHDLSVHIARLPELQRGQLLSVVDRYLVKTEEYTTIRTSLARRIPSLEGRIREQLYLLNGQRQLALEAAASPAAATQGALPGSVATEITDT